MKPTSTYMIDSAVPLHAVLLIALWSPKIAFADRFVAAHQGATTWGYHGLEEIYRTDEYRTVQLYQLFRESRVVFRSLRSLRGAFGPSPGGLVSGPLAPAWGPPLFPPPPSVGDASRLPLFLALALETQTGERVNLIVIITRWPPRPVGIIIIIVV